MAKVGTAYVEVRGDFSQFNRQVRSQTSATTSQFKQMGKAAAAGFGAAALGAGVVKATKTFVDFDRSMRNVNSIAKLSEKRFDALSKRVLNLAGPTAQAPQTLADGLYQLVSSGFDANDAIKVLEKSAIAATAGLTDTATSAQVIAAAINAYGLAASDAGRVSDILFRTVDRGVLTFSDLAQNLGPILPAANNLNVSLVQVGAALASLTKQGFPAAEAATAIDAAMRALLKPSESMQAAFKQLGVSGGEELVRKYGSLQAALDAVRKTTDGSGSAMNKLFNEIRGARGAISLTGGQARGAARDLDALGKSAGSTSRAFKEQAKSAGVQWQRLKAQMSAVAAEIGAKVFPIFRRLIIVALGAQKAIEKGFRALGRFMVDVWSAPKRAFGNLIASILRAFAKLFDAASKLPVVGDRFDGMAEKVRDAAAKVDQLGEKIQTLPDVDVQVRVLQSGEFPRLQPPGRLRRRRGGMVPAMLSPGEVGITPGGGSFRVPGPRTAADSVPMRLPYGTAVLTSSGQRILQRTGSVVQAIRDQLPHFQKGGVVKAAAAAYQAGFRGGKYGPHLVPMVAIAGRESGYNPRATNFDYPDHSIGYWQINQLAHKGRFGSDEELMNPLVNAKAAFSLFKDSGYQPWVGLDYGNARSFLDEARAAAAKVVSGKGGLAVDVPGGSFTRTTPAPTTFPLLATQLRPIVDDALLGGLEAARERTGRGGRVDFLQQVLEGIVPESTDRATRERITLEGREAPGGGGGSTATGPVATRIAAMQAFGNKYAGRGYTYGGGHGQIGVPSGRPPSFDCSGYVSGILHAGGLLDTPLTTLGLYNWGKAGKGRNVSVGIRGGGGQSGHTMMQVGDLFYESGGGGGTGRRSGWNGAFDSYRHPMWRTGGVVGMRRGGVALAARNPKQIRRRIRELEAQRKRIVAGGITKAEKPVLIEIQRLLTEYRQMLRDMQPRFPGSDPKWARAGGIVRMRRGGVMGEPSTQGKRELEKLSRKKGVPVETLLDPKSKDFVGWGMQRGGIVGEIGEGGFDFERWLRQLRKKGRKPTLGQLVSMLGADQLGSRNADLVTRTLSQRVQGRSVGALERAERRAKQQIRKMSRKGFTGPERIRTRRLRGAIGLVQEQQGRIIGGPLGASDRAQSRIERQQANFPNQLILQGVDPESVQGLEAQRGQAQSALGTLMTRRQALGTALRRARKTGNRKAAQEVQTEINEVDDQMDQLKASIVTLTQSIQAQMPTATDFANRDLALAQLTETLDDDRAALQRLEQIAQDQLNAALATADPRDDIEAAQNLKGIRDQLKSIDESLEERDKALQDLIKEQIDQLKRNAQFAQTQGPALQAALTQFVTFGVGGVAGRARSFPSSPGVAGLARS